MDPNAQDDEKLNSGGLPAEEAGPQSEPTKDLRSEIVAARDEIKSRQDGDSKPSKNTKLSLTPKSGAPAHELKEGVQSENNTSVRAPKAWKADMHEKFSTLPPEVQKYISDREDEVYRGFTKLDEDRNFGKSLRETIQPYLPMIAAEKGTPLTAVQTLLNTAYVLRTASPAQKSQMIKQVCRDYGVDVRSLNAPAQAIDPNVSALQNRIAQLEGTLTKQDTDRQQAEFWKNQQDQEEVNRLISDFRSDPANVHFETLRPYMQAMLEKNLATDLKDAYEKAMYAHPDIRSTVQQAHTADTEQRRIADKSAKAEQARRAGASVTGGPGVAVPNNVAPDRSLADELRANYRAFTG